MIGWLKRLEITCVACKYREEGERGKEREIEARLEKRTFTKLKEISTDMEWIHCYSCYKTESSLTPSYSRNNSDGKASPKRQNTKHLNTRNHNGHTRIEYVLLILRVKCSYFGIFSVVSRPYFIPRTISWSALTVPSQATQAPAVRWVVVNILI